MKLLHLLLFLHIFNAYSQKYSWDLTFGGTGKIITNFGGQQFASDGKLGIQSDGKYILIGTEYFSDTRNASFDIIISRYTNAGKLDSTFGISGKTVIDYNFSDDRIVDFAIQKDDKIIISTQIRKSVIEHNIYRFNKNGTPDITFGTNGIVNNGYLMCDLVLTPSGEIIIAGTKTTNGVGKIALTKYNKNGVKISSFGINGDADLDFKTNEYCFAIDTLNNSDIVVLGLYSNGTSNDNILFKLSKNGILYSNFGNSGFSIIKRIPNYSLTYLKTQSNNKIIVSGVSNYNGMSTQEYFVFKFTSNGNPDSTYSNKGLLNIKHPFFVGPHHIEIDSIDNLFVLETYGGNTIFISKFNPDGKIKLDFGDSGKISFKFDSCSINPCMTRLQNDGKIMVSGFVKKKNAVAELFIARFKQAISNTNTVNFNLSNDIRIYPNPTNSLINIEINRKNLKINSIQIHDIYGQLLYTNINIINNTDTIDISHLSSGNYIITIDNYSYKFRVE